MSNKIILDTFCGVYKQLSSDADRRHSTDFLTVFLEMAEWCKE
jgi:hypothetical protein